MLFVFRIKFHNTFQALTRVSRNVFFALVQIYAISFRWFIQSFQRNNDDNGNGSSNDSNGGNGGGDGVTTIYVLQAKKSPYKARTNVLITPLGFRIVSAHTLTHSHTTRHRQSESAALWEMNMKIGTWTPLLFSRILSHSSRYMYECNIVEASETNVITIKIGAR